MKSINETGQKKVSIDKNTDYFLGQHDSYRKKIGEIDSYKLISCAISEKLMGVNKLLDIGNGGVFDYDTSLVSNIIGVDLFLDRLPQDIALPANIKMVQGSALDLPKTLGVFDAVVMVMLIHHLVGEGPDSCKQNAQKAISEANRVLVPGGKLIIMESCVPAWFYKFENIVFNASAMIIERLLKHPPTLQYPENVLIELMKNSGFESILSERIPKGRHILQYGFKVPSFLTPVQPTLFVATKS